MPLSLQTSCFVLDFVCCVFAFCQLTNPTTNFPKCTLIVKQTCMSRTIKLSLSPVEGFGEVPFFTKYLFFNADYFVHNIHSLHWMKPAPSIHPFTHPSSIFHHLCRSGLRGSSVISEDQWHLFPATSASSSRGYWGIPRPDDRCNPSNVSWVYPRVISLRDMPETSPHGNGKEASSPDAETSSSGSSQCEEAVGSTPRLPLVSELRNLPLKSEPRHPAEKAYFSHLRLCLYVEIKDLF